MIMTVRLCVGPDNGPQVTSDFTVAVPDIDTVERTYERTLDGLYSNLAMQLTSLGAALVAAVAKPAPVAPAPELPGKAAVPQHMLTGGPIVRRIDPPTTPVAPAAPDAPIQG